MININATFSHYFLQVSVGDAVAHVEKHGIQYNTLGELVHFEINHHNQPRPFQEQRPASNTIQLC
jgi:hypothetical protein